MAVLKCKMCGGDLNVTETDAVIQCEYCGTRQTVPTADNEKKLNLFNRANRLRMASEFDKAAGIYESIIAEFPEEAEAYWGLCLCNYGIEYVDDPATARKIPTCHRASFEALQKDENFELALEYADVVAQKLYRDEAREIDRIMSEILSVSKNEKPYDVFICYKETDDKGQRTPDSVLAQDIYDALTAKGLKVFFSRITLEDKLGMQYEPYIFAALNSAKVMLSIGTKYEYFHAVWVKNEWSRFLKLMAKDKSKVLIPCFKDIDAYDMPDEFKGLQAQDLGKLGAVQDIVRGVEKIVGKTAEKVVTEKIVSGVSADYKTEACNLVNIGFIDMQTENTERAEQSFRTAVEKDVNNAMAYIGLCLLDSTSEKEKEVYIERIKELSPDVSESEKNIIFKDDNLTNKYMRLFLRYTSYKRLKYIFDNYPEYLNKAIIKTEKNNYSALNYAITVLVNISLVSMLLKFGADSNKSYRVYTNGDKFSALSDAIWNAKNVRMVKMLLEAGADANIIENIHNDNGKLFSDSMLTLAINNAKSVEMVELLLKFGADPNSYRVCTNGDKHSALGDAIWNAKDVRMVKMLLEAGADPNRILNEHDDNEKPFSKSMLTCAIIHANSAEMVELLLKYGADPNSYRVHTNGDKYSALSDAICNAKDVQMVKLLLEAGADPNSFRMRTNGDKYSALSDAICNAKDVQMVKLLLESGADPNAISVDTDGEHSALGDAISCVKNVQMVKLLLESGADPNISDNLHSKERFSYIPYSRSMLYYAIVDAKSVEIAKLLLKYGAKPKGLYHAIRENDVQMVKLLLESGADPDEIVYKDTTILYCAIVNKKSVEMVELLLKYGADPNRFAFDIGAREGKNLPLLFYAIKEENKDMVELLIKYGANWETEIYRFGKPRKLKKYPFNKYPFKLSAEFIRFLRNKGWTGTLFD